MIGRDVRHNNCIGHHHRQDDHQHGGVGADSQSERKPKHCHQDRFGSSAPAAQPRKSATAARLVPLHHLSVHREPDGEIEQSRAAARSRCQSGKYADDSRLAVVSQTTEIIGIVVRRVGADMVNIVVPATPERRRQQENKKGGERQYVLRPTASQDGAMTALVP